MSITSSSQVHNVPAGDASEELASLRSDTKSSFSGQGATDNRWSSFGGTLGNLGSLAERAKNMATGASMKSDNISEGTSAGRLNLGFGGGSSGAPFAPMLVTAKHLQETQQACHGFAVAAKDEAVVEGQQYTDVKIEGLELLVGEQLTTLRDAFAEQIEKMGRALDRAVARTDETLKKMSEEASMRAMIDAAVTQLTKEVQSHDARLKTIDARNRTSAEGFQKQSQALEAQLESVRTSVDRSLEQVRADIAALKAQGASIEEEVSSTLKESTADMEGRLYEMERVTNEVREQTQQLESLSNRRVDFLVSAQELLELRKKLKSTADVAKAEDWKTWSWCSPSFSVAGLHGFELELRPVVAEEAKGEMATGTGTAAAAAATEEEGRPDFQLYLWGRDDVHAVLKLHCGSVVESFHHSFGDDAACTLPPFRLEDALEHDPEQRLRLAVEVLEGVSFYRGTSQPLQPRHRVGFQEKRSSRQLQRSNSTAAQHQPTPSTKLEGCFEYHRYLCPTSFERMSDLEQQFQRLRSRIIGRVEWRLDQATYIRQYFPQGSCLCSVVFSAGGFSDLQLVFYPSGDRDARDQYCSMYIYAPEVEAMQCYLTVGRQRKEVCAVRGRPNWFGKSNFGIFEGCLERGGDTLVIAVEIAEAQQVAPSVQSMPWTALAERPVSPSAAASEDLFLRGGATSSMSSAQQRRGGRGETRSITKLQGQPGRLAMEDTFWLPDIWSSAPKTYRPTVQAAKPGLSLQYLQQQLHQQQQHDIGAGKFPPGFRMVGDWPKQHQDSSASSTCGSSSNYAGNDNVNNNYGCRYSPTPTMATTVSPARTPTPTLIAATTATSTRAPTPNLRSATASPALAADSRPSSSPRMPIIASRGKVPPTTPPPTAASSTTATISVTPSASASCAAERAATPRTPAAAPAAGGSGGGGGGPGGGGRGGGSARVGSRQGH